MTVSAYIPKIILSLVSVGSAVGGAVILLGQALFNPTAEGVERIVGGSLLLVAAVLVIRWTFRMLAESREIAKADREAALKREQMLISQLDQLQERLLAAYAELELERQTRLSLEQMGLTDRRTKYIDEEEEPL